MEILIIFKQRFGIIGLKWIVETFSGMYCLNIFAVKSI